MDLQIWHWRWTYPSARPPLIINPHLQAPLYVDGEPRFSTKNDAWGVRIHFQLTIALLYICTHNFTDRLWCSRLIAHFSLQFSSFSDQQVKKKPPYLQTILQYAIWYEEAQGQGSLLWQIFWLDERAWDQEGNERSCSHFYLCALNKQAWRQTLQDCSNQYEHLVAPKNKINFGIQTNSIPIGRKSNSK